MGAYGYVEPTDRPATAGNVDLQGIPDYPEAWNGSTMDLQPSNPTEEEAADPAMVVRHHCLDNSLDHSRSLRQLCHLPMESCSRTFSAESGSHR